MGWGGGNDTQHGGGSFDVPFPLPDTDRLSLASVTWQRLSPGHVPQLLQSLLGLPPPRDGSPSGPESSSPSRLVMAIITLAVFTECC
ncbi:unnamed protein product [Gulo gulo]|uniref:Uncharacterized protein n=1 Tax=Gulo gulo TaxID=48420 RepID=A0A9X9Q7H5_GULGU|nr:unnamed protein product [Gulo gulo]